MLRMFGSNRSEDRKIELTHEALPCSGNFNVKCSSKITLRPDAGEPRSPRSYCLADVRLSIPDSVTAIFHMKLLGPSEARVWVRAWLANEIDGTLAETATGPWITGQEVSLTVTLNDHREPEAAYIRIESAPLCTEHVVCIRLPRE